VTSADLEFHLHRLTVNEEDMSAPRDHTPEGMQTSLTSYKEYTPQSQALRRRNIIVPPLYFGMVAPKIYRRFIPVKSL
jgi:hypothetical protein